MRSFHKLLPLVLVLGFSACSSAPAPGAGAADGVTPAGSTEQAAETGGTAVGSEASVIARAQAERGRNAFLASCTACHASGEFTASAFRRRWSTRNAADLYRLVSTTMPEDAPSSLAPERYVEVVAYILSMNGFESAASAQPWDVSALDGVSLAPLSGN